MKAALFSVLLFWSYLCSAANAPFFYGERLSGERTSLAKHLKKDRLLLISFWASWCTPCLEELSQLKKARKSHPDLPLDVLAINVDTSETASDAKPTYQALQLPFPVILDPKHSIFRKYRIEKSLPYSVLIDGKRKIIESFTGFHANMIEHLQALAKTHLPSVGVVKHEKNPAS